ncbi:MAG: serine/threonine protein phosphatase, partial [Xenococcus sp. (in: cyanobacteria)]
VAQSEIKQGVSPEIAFARPDALQLTQALGPRDNDFVHPEIYFIDLKEDTLLLLCSDGLYSNDLLENNYQKLLLPLISSSSNLEEGLTKIVDFANEINGHDNITGLLVRIKVQPNLENKSTLF